jgi:hypothetical protein
MPSGFSGPDLGLLGGAPQEFQLPGVLPFSASRLCASLTSFRQTLSPENDRLLKGSTHWFWG